MRPYSVLLGLLLIDAVYCEQYKILFMLPMAGKSHKNVFIPLMEALAARGHDVTVISPIKPPKTVPNLKEIVIEGQQHHEPRNKQEGDTAVKNAEEEKAKLDAMIKHLMNMKPLLTFFTMSSFVTPFCENFLSSSATKEIIKQGKVFDLVVVNGFVNECALPVGKMVGKHVIYLLPPAMPGIGVGATPRPPSYVSTTLAAFPSHMDFYHRLKNTVYTMVMLWSYDYFMVSKMQNTVSKFLPESPPIREVINEIRFILYNADPVLTPPHPGISNIMAVGGMHCKDAKPLPKEFEDFIQSSGEHGFIYFSLGSNIPSRALPIETRQAFVSAFARLKQKVIWKYEEDLPGKPENVMITKWAPQQDVLGHPKIRLFISHGGLLSMQETVYHGVPVIGFPILGDQPGNVYRIAELKLGEQMSLATVSESLVYDTINRILDDKTYSANMKKYSAIFRDQPQKPLDRAIFWTEYIIRHDGALHLRPAGEDLNFIQYFLLDVIGFLVFVAAAAIFILVKTVKIVLSFRKTKTSEKKKTN